MRGSSRNRVGGAEQIVMEVLWSSADALTAADVARRTEPVRDWGESAVKTMRSRLAAKEVLDQVARAPACFYRSTVHRDDGALIKSRRLLDRLFSGDVTPLLARPVQSGENLSPRHPEAAITFGRVWR